MTLNPLKFHGYSDDTFGEYGRTNDNHDNCASCKPMRFRVTSGEDSLIVVGQYSGGPAATWTVGVEMDEQARKDFKPLPSWPMRLRAPNADETSYSPTLEIDAPEGATVTYILADGTVPKSGDDE